MSKLTDYLINHDFTQHAIELFCEHGATIDGTHIKAHRFKTFEPKPHQIKPTNDFTSEKSVIVQLPVGFGKTNIFQRAIALDNKCAYIIMPTIALALDMKKRFDGSGAKVALWSSVTPERDKKDFRENKEQYHAVILAPEAMPTVPIIKGGLLIVDEAHNITMSANFRASFSKIGKFRHKIEASAVGLFSATMDSSMIDEIKSQFFGCDFIEHRHKNPDRDNIQYHTPMERGYSMDLFFELLEENAKTGRSAIVYAYKVANVDHLSFRMSPKLKEMGYEVIPFHSKVKKKNEKMKLFTEKQSCVFATSAFGEGIDKEDIGLIIRLGFPFSMTQLVQEAGRVERGGKRDGHYYWFRLGDEKAMFHYNKLVLNSVNKVLDKISEKRYEPFEFTNFMAENNVLTFLNKSGIINVEVEHTHHYTIELTGKDYTRSKHAWFLNIIKSKKKWLPNELEEVSIEYQDLIKKVSSSGYIDVEKPSSKSLYKKVHADISDQAKTAMLEHNEKLDKDLADLDKFFKSNDKKEYIRQYFEGE